MKKFFKKAVAGLILSSAMVMASTPAIAGKDFYKKDFRDKDTEVVQLAAEHISDETLVFVVHGGNKTLMMAAYRVAQRLDDEGVPVAFLLAPDRDGLDISMHVDYYTKGGTKYYVTAYDNEKITVETTEADLYGQAMKAYMEDFSNLAKKTHPDLDENAPAVAMY